MHKKIIHGKEYYYASYREDGKVKSKYLGSDKKLAIKKEREFNGTGPGGLWMYGLIIILLGLCSIGGYTITGFMTYDGGVDLAWNETWDVESSFVRVSLGAEVYDVPVSVVDGVVSLDLSSFDFNSTGVGYVDLVVNETVVESVSFEIEEVVEESYFNESLSAQNLTLNDTELNNSVDGFNSSLDLNETVEDVNESVELVNESVEEVNESVEDVNESVEEIVNESLNVSVEVPIVNLTANETVVIPVNISLNITDQTVNYTIAGVNVSEEVVQYGAVIGEPVKWKKKIVLSEETANLVVDIPETAENVTVIEIVNDVETVLDNVLVNDSGVISDLDGSDLDSPTGFFNLISGMFSASITGFFVAEEPVENITLIIEEEVEEVEVEYYTEAPEASEENTSYGKKVVVSSETHYENILTYTVIPETELGAVNLYWVVNGSRVSHAFDGYDTNEDGLVDYLEWVTPHTSEQEFQIELTILNVQSYPIVGGTWTVMFNTSGTADLSVNAINSTSFGVDLEFIEIKCGNETVNSTYNGSIFVEDYSCNETGYEVSKVLTAGVHDLEFRFGNITAYAHNDASYPNCAGNTSAGDWVISTGTSTTSDIICNTIVINNSATLTVDSITNLSQIEVRANNITIASGASISANSKGCPSTQSPSAGSGCSSTQTSAPGYGEGEDNSNDGGAGAGYGGRGGDRDNDAESGGYAYGTALTPNLMGSGGGASDGAGGVGGGAVFINVSDTFTLNGTVTATGGNGVNAYDAGGAGSGGAIWVITDTMKGTGSFSANGGTGGTGDTDSGGGGAGGRIAVHFNTLEDLDITSSSVTGGTGPGGAYDGDDGTIGFIDEDDDTLTISKGWEFQNSVNYTNITVYNSLVAINSSLRVNISDLYSYGYFNLTCWNSAYDFEFNVSNDANFSKFRMKNLGTGGSDCDKVDINASINTLSDFPEFVIEANDNVTLDLGDNVNITGGTITLNNKMNWFFILTPTNLTLENTGVTGNIDWLLNNLSMDSSSSLSANSRGCTSTQSPNGLYTCASQGTTAPGYGEGEDQSSDGGAGAGYGGAGGDRDNDASSGGFSYGTALTPNLVGSGGGSGDNANGGVGGGAIKINVTDTFVLNGTISSTGGNGVSDSDASGAGSGGAIWIITDTMKGTGSMSANGGTGGDGGSDDGGGGGAGRIAVHFNTLEDLDITSSSVIGGTGPGGATDGDDGTIGFIDEDDDTLTISKGWEFQNSVNYTNITVYNSLVRLNKSVRINISDLYSYGNFNLTCYSSAYDFEFNVSNDFNLSNFRAKDLGTRGVDCDDIHINASINSHTYFPGLVIESNGNITLGIGSNVTINSGTLTCNNDRDFFKLSGNPILRLESTTITANVDLVSPNFTLDSGSSINANNKGFGGGATQTAGSGPGGGVGDMSSGSGAGHGGYGETAFENSDPGDRYGSALEPYNLGSGGGGGQYCTGADGGGMVKINVSDILELNGSISVNGADRAACDTNDEGGAGSGGSIWLIADTLRGTGSLTADGGTASGTNQGGGGAGGRIVAHFNTLEDLDITSSSVTGGPGYASGIADQGSLGFIDDDDDTLTIYEGWDFSENVNYTNITVYNSFVKLNKSLRINISDLYSYGDLNITCWGSGNDFEFNITGDANFSNFRMKNYGYGGSDCDNIGINASVNTHTYFPNFVIESNGNITLDIGSNVTINSGTLTCNNDRDFVFFRTSPILRFESSTITACTDWVLDNFTLDSGSSMSANNKGFGGGATQTTGSGPGGGVGDMSSGSGAGHGGYGETAFENSDPGDRYGSALEPYNLGSGGGGGQYCTGADGGGMVKINVSDILELNGSISVNGADRAGCNIADEGGAGSGGSIWLITDTLRGTGSLTSDGGTASGTNQGGGGAGGRIVAHFNTLEDLDITSSSVTGGPGYASGIGDQGSLGFIDDDDDTLTIYEGWDFSENVNYTNITVYNSFVKLNKSLRINISDLYSYGDFNITCWGSGNDFEFNITGDANFSNFRMKNYGYGGSDCDNIGINASVNTHTYFSNFVIESNGNITLDIGSNVTINSGTLTCNNDRDFVFFRTSPILRLESSTITACTDWILSNFTLDSGSSMSANNKGFGGGATTTTGSGPGGGTGDSFDSGSGGGHGGAGGVGYNNVASGSACDSISAPIDHGSGGGGGQYCTGSDGGGMVKINVSDILELNGSISVNGADRAGCNDADEGGAGSGGSIWLITDTLRGTGSLTSDGGTASGTNQGGGGGGGRIAVYYSIGEYNGTLNANGGTGYNNGAVGTRLKVQGLSNMKFSGDSNHNLFVRNGSVELKTNFSSTSSVEINRTVLTIWNNSLVHFNDSSSTGITASYNITGFKATTNYSVENNSVEIALSPIQSYATGNLPLFSVALNSPHEVKVQELVTPIINSVNTFNSTGQIVNDSASLNNNNNVTFNVSITQGSNPISAVWVIIWSTVSGGSEYANELMTTDGVNYTVNVFINNSLYSLVNYTVYSNDSLNYQSSLDGNFSLTLPPRYDGSTIYNPIYLENVTINSNVTGVGLVGVNFTITRYTDNVNVLDNVAAVVNSSMLWNSSSTNLSQCTEYNYSVLAWNSAGLTSTSYGNITLLCVDVNLNTTSIPIGGNVEIYGIVNLTNGTVVANNTLAVFQNSIANSSIVVPGWDDSNFTYRMNFTFTQPNNFSGRSGEHVLINATFIEERLRNETGPVLYCNGSQVAFDSYNVSMSNGWVTQLEGLAEVNFTGDSNLTCQLYYDPGYNGTASALVNTGWHYVGDSGNDGTNYEDISPAMVDCNGKDADGQFTSICSASDNLKMNEWCYFKAPATDSGEYFKTGSDDGTALWVDDVIAVADNDGGHGEQWRDNVCGACSGTISVTIGRFYALEIDWAEGGGGQVAYNRYNDAGDDSGGSVIDTECYPFYGDEWLIKVVNTSEENNGVAIQTNSTGGYNYTITANSGGGTFPIKVNTTFAGIYGWSFANLIVYQEPSIDSVTFLGSNSYSRNITIQANITDDNLAGVNFTITRNDGTVVLNNQVGTNGSATSWNSTSVNLTECVSYNYSVHVWDEESYNVTSYGNITLACVEMSLNATSVKVNSSFDVYGTLNFTNGTSAVNASMRVQIGGAEHAFVEPWSELLAWWRLDENVGASSFIDWSSNDLSASCTNCPTQVRTRFKNASYFNNASRNYISVTDNALFESENFTVSAWVKYDALGGSNNVDTNNQIIVGKESYELGVDNQGVPYFNIQNDTIINNLTNDSYTVLLDIGGAGDADSSHIGYETNIYRKDDAYEMWTGCHNGSSWFVCYANSSDSISWSKYASNPVLDLGANGQWDDFGVLPIDVIVDEGYYHMWYFGFNGSHWEGIGYANSSDGLNWTKHAANPIMNRSNPGGWDDDSLGYGDIIKENDYYHMWYGAYNGTHWAGVGYANSSDGLNWTRYASNPVFKGDNSGFDASQVIPNSVIKDGDVYRMWYSGYSSSWQPGYATSTDGLSWTTFADPILTLGASGSYDDAHAYMPAAFKDGNEYKVYYAMHDGTNVRLGFANSSVGIISDSAITAGEWTSLTATKNGSDINLYVGDTRVASGTVEISTLATSSDLIMGDYLNGTLDEVRIFNRSLTNVEVYDLSGEKANSTEGYSSTYYAPSVAGTYSVEVNTSFRGVMGGSSVVSLTVYQEPVIDSVTILTDQQFGKNISLQVNVTDDNLKGVNFTITRNDNTIVLNNQLGTNETVATSWNSTSTNLSQCTGYNYTVYAWDAGGYNVTSIGNLSLVCVELNLNATSVAVDGSVLVSGIVNLTNGTAVADATVYIYLNESLQTSSGNGDGSDSALNVSSANVIINNYTYLTTTENASNLTIAVFNGTEFSAGDEILIIQMQNGTGSGAAGRYEFVEIESKSGNKLTLSEGLNFTYGSGTFNTSSSVVTQVVRVPEYTTVDVDSGASIVASAWTGWTGGIVVFKAQSDVIVNGAINVSGSGFRGGMKAPSASDYQWGYSGERTAGSSTARVSNGNSIALGGGGAGKGADGSGGGGSYGVAGSDGTHLLGSSDHGLGASAFGAANLNLINFGGGGGSAGSHSSTRVGVAGGEGGGILIIYGANILNSGSILAKGHKGKDGVTGGDANRGAGGGGGAGGSIYIITAVINNTGIINASGSRGGIKHVGSNGRDGGNGSVGRIRFDFNTYSGSAATPASGFNGTYLSNSVTTNSSGWYTYNLTLNDSGLQTIKVNTTFTSLYGESFAVLDVVQAPTVTLGSPINLNYSVELESVYFNCSVADGDGDLANVTLYHNLGGTWGANGTRTVSGSSNDSIFVENIQSFTSSSLRDSNYIWNCYARDQTNLVASGTNATFGSWDLGNYTEDTVMNTSSDGFISLSREDNYSTQEMLSGQEDGWIDMTGNVLYLRFNNDSSFSENDQKNVSNSVYDFSERGNSGTLGNATSGSNPVWNSSAKLGGAYEFDGKSQTITVSSDATNDGFQWGSDFSIVVWVRTNDSNSGILARGDFDGNWEANEKQFYIAGGKPNFVGHSNDYIKSGTVVSDNTWHHIALTWNDGSSTGRIYVDGQNRTTYDLYAGNNDAGTILRVAGDTAGEAVKTFNGSMDELGVWNRSLGAAEILSIFNKQKHAYHPEGNYTSRVLDAGRNSSWLNVTWDANAPYGEELPSLQSVENLAGGVNMTGNVLYLRFNNDSSFSENDQRNVSNSVYDFSGTGNNASLGNVTSGTNPFVVNGKLGGGYGFDGNNDYIALDETSFDFERTDPFTYSIWLKTNDSTDHHIFSKGLTPSTQTGLRMGFEWGGFAIFLVNNWGTNIWLYRFSSVTLSDSEWHHVVATYDGGGVDSGLHMYVDGELSDGSSANTLSTNTILNNDPLLIGSDSYPNEYFNGTLDEVAIWNRSLSADEILNIYKRGALNLNLSARSCDDSSCSGESWTAVGGNSSFNSLSLAINRYFQYMMTYETDDTLYTPELNLSSVVVGYSVLNTAPQVTNVTMNSTSDFNYSNSSLQTYWKIWDADSDSESSSWTWWWKDGVKQSVLENETSITANNLSKNQIWNMSVRLYDSLDWSNWSSNLSVTVANTPPNYSLLTPSDAQLLLRSVSPLLNVSFTDPDSDPINVSFINDSDDVILCQVNNSNKTSACVWPGLNPNMVYSWYVNISDGDDVVQSDTFNFTPNDEPGVMNMRIDMVNATAVRFAWENELDMSWVSLRIGSDILELRSITSSNDNWTIYTIYPDQEYVFEWQTGDDLLAQSDYHNFTFRTFGWHTNLTNFTYRRVMTVNQSNISSDVENWGVNITLTEDNFEYYDSANWVWYPSFTRMNWSNNRDFRFVDYKDKNLLAYNVTYWNVPGRGGVSVQTAPNATAQAGGWVDFSQGSDEDWDTQMTPSPYGEYYYNYTIPVGAKNGSKYRIYDGGWGWDLTLPVGCYGGTDLQLKTVSNYSNTGVNTYCWNNTGSEWAFVRNNGNVSAYVYETMMTWLFDCEVHITVMPQHYNDTNQTYNVGLDSDYDVKFWMYYGSLNATDNTTVLSPSYIESNATHMAAETARVLGTPTISNINDTVGRTSTGTNISWDTDQSSDHRVRYSDNKWFLNATWHSRKVNNSETCEHLYGNDEQTVLISAYGDDYIQTLNVSCENANYNSNYTINESANPVSIVFADLDNSTFFNWTVNYTWNRTQLRDKFSAEYQLESLPGNTTYYYEINVYGQTANNTDNSTFTLGTAPSTPALTILNYSENRSGKQATICANLTDLNSESEVNCSIQYWNQSSVDFMTSSVTNLSAIGSYCVTVDVEYGQNYTYRAKGQASTTGYSLEYLNDFMLIQEFFAGSYVDDDNDDRNRQYCPDGPAIEPCYEQTGYLEGSLQEEDWIWIETNQSNRGNLTVNWWNGSVWTAYNMTNDGDSDMQYLKLEDLGPKFQTFYITNNSDDLVFNWTKPSPIHSPKLNRTDESKYVSFNGTPAPVNYTLLYFDAKYYNSSAYQWCMAAPGGNLYDCMSIQYFGGGLEGGWGPEYSGTAYDRGRMFRGGIANGELNDTGVLNLERRTNFTDAYDYRYCFAFTVFWWNESVVPTNNVSNYYYHYWTQNDWWSDYFGATQSRRFDFVSLFTWEYDLLSQTRDWNSIDNTTMNTERMVLNTSNSTFNTPYNQSLVVGHRTGFDYDVRDDQIYDFGFYTDGRWTNQQFGQYQQGFVVFNLPPNATLQAMDTDNDSISDFDELFVYYTNPKHNDTDEDSRIDSDEINLSYDPNLYTEYGTAPTVEVPVLDRDSHVANTSYVANATYSDFDSDNATVYIVWYKNGVAIYNETQTSVTNGTVINSTLDSNNFSKSDVINVSIYAVDTFTQTSTLVNTTTTVQNLAPLFNVSLGAKAVNSTDDFTYHFNCSDIDGDSISYYDNSSLFEVNITTGYINVSASQADFGTHRVNVTCGDGTNNRSQIMTYTINDTEIPIVTKVGPGFVVKNRNPILRVTSNENVNCQFRRLNTSFIDFGSTGTTNHNHTLNLGYGMHTYRVRCNDSTGNINVSNVHFYVTGVNARRSNFNFSNFNTSGTAVFNLMNTFNASVDVTENSSSYLLGAEYDSNPSGDNLSVDGSNVDSLGYFSVSTADEVRGNLTSASLQFGYSESDLTDLGITESDLTVYYYNDSADSWTEQTVVANTALNYLELNITHMSVFFMGGVVAIPVAEEEEEAAAGGGGGGGGGASRDDDVMRAAEFYVPTNFSLSSDEFTFDLSYEESKEEILTITNNLGSDQKFVLSTQYIGSVLTLSSHEFTLSPFESIDITLHAVSDREPGVHVGNLVVKSEYETQVLPLVVEISSQVVLFDGTVYIPAEYKEVSSGESIPAQITLFNIGSPRKVDVLLNYIISDINGNVIVEESETVGVEGQYSYTRDFYVPSDANDGTYVLSLEVVYVNSVATSSAMFDVVGDVKYGAPTMESKYVYLVLGLIGLIGLIGIIVVFRRRRNA